MVKFGERDKSRLYAGDLPAYCRTAYCDGKVGTYENVIKTIILITFLRYDLRRHVWSVGKVMSYALLQAAVYSVVRELYYPLLLLHEILLPAINNNTFKCIRCN